VLRGAYLALFAGQAVAAALVAGAAVAVAGPQTAPSGWVAGVALAASTGQLLLGVAITSAGVRNAGRAARRLDAWREEAADAPADAPADVRSARSAALSLSLLAAVLLSTPAWFAAFAWATGQGPVTLAGIGTLLAVGYAFGTLQLGSLARSVTRRASGSAPSPEPDADA
jgi:hypothetical protein